MYSPSDLVATGIILPLLGVIAVCFRFYVRHSSKTSIGVDDWLILAACVLVCGMGAMQVIATYFGELGRDGQTLEPKRAHVSIKVDFSMVVIEKIAYGFIKLSVLLFYRRIFITPMFRLVNNIMIALISLWTLSFFLAQILICGMHPNDQWKKDPSTWHCGNLSLLLLWFAITDVIGDIAVLAMPYPCIKRLQMSRRDKISVSGIFMLGTLALAAGVTRLGFVTKAYITRTVKLDASGRPTSGLSSPPFLWTNVEVSAAIVAACLPTWAPFVRRLPSFSKIALYFRLKFSRHAERKRFTEITPRSVYSSGGKDDAILATRHAQLEMTNDPRGKEEAGMDSLNDLEFSMFSETAGGRTHDTRQWHEG